jgi:hypothetical protein
MKGPPTELVVKMARVLSGQPINDVIPILITTSARCLVDCSQGDTAQLEKDYTQFCEMVQDQMRDMLEWDEAEAREATKQ